MGRGAFLALLVTRQADDSAAVLAGLTSRLAREVALTAAVSRPNFSVWTVGSRPPPTTLLPQGAGAVVGDLFTMPDGDAVSALPQGSVAQGSEATARWLSRNQWGRYVAVLPGREAGVGVYRDPSGHWECLVWPVDGVVWAIASELTAVPRWLHPRRMSLNWDRIAQFVAMPSTFTTPSLFDDVDTVGPGEWRPITANSVGRAKLIWRPADHIRSRCDDLPGARAELRSRVDICTSALASQYERLICQLSGGLDSSILAGSLAATGHAPRVVQWLNRVGDRAEADERVYAQAVTSRLGVDLTAAAKPLTPLAEVDLAELSDALWPAMNGADPWRDRDEAARLYATGAGAVVSGQGGDAAFFQPPTVAIIADAWRADGWSVLSDRLLPETARRTRQSVWRVLIEARRAHRGKSPPLMTPSMLMSAEVRALASGGLHPWAADAVAQGAPPGKTFQILGLANHQIYSGDSRSRRTGDTLFPLLAQPVLEHCLSIPIPDLVRGGDDRPFARAAFADRLPELVFARRRKGDYGSFFAHLVAASLETLRPLLLDGCLCRAGVLDRQAVESLLDPDRLIWSERSIGLLWAATAECWVRYWQTRVPDSPKAAR
jgi:asparagine synthase (glutamine-hydrolysing)